MIKQLGEGFNKKEHLQFSRRNFHISHRNDIYCCKKMQIVQNPLLITEHDMVLLAPCYKKHNTGCRIDAIIVSMATAVFNRRTFILFMLQYTYQIYILKFSNKKTEKYCINLLVMGFVVKVAQTNSFGWQWFTS
jgi:hypothetical protein